MAKISDTRGYRSALLAALALGAAVAVAFSIRPPASPDRSAHREHRPLAHSLAPAATLPSVGDQRLQPLSPEEAAAANAALPLSTAPVESARPFVALQDATLSLARKSALDCLTAAIYYEAASEGEDGQRAVAQVVLNRVRHPAFPKSVCGVVFQGAERVTGCQFSFTCDGSLTRRPVSAWWNRARRIAEQALSGSVFPGVGTATHYHAYWVLPYWAGTLDKVTNIKAHIFYRWQGYWGERRAFSGRYAGEEPMAAATIDGRVQFASLGSGGALPEIGLPPGDGEAAGLASTTRSAIAAPLHRIATPDLPKIAQASLLLADQRRELLSADRNRGELILHAAPLPGPAQP